MIIGGHTICESGSISWVEAIRYITEVWVRVLLMRYGWTTTLITPSSLTPPDCLPSTTCHDHPSSQVLDHAPDKLMIEKILVIQRCLVGNLLVLSFPPMLIDWLARYSLSNADKAVFTAVPGVPDKGSCPNSYRWYIHVAALSGIRT